MKRIVFVASVLLVVLVCTANAAVNLEWRPAQQTVSVGDQVNMDLYFVPEADGQLVSAADVIISWDPSVLYLNGLGDMSPLWFYDGMFDTATDGINDSWDDGTVLYSAWGALGEPIPIPTEGSFAAEFQFTALAPSQSSTVSILGTFGQFTTTGVYDGTEANLDVKGALGQATVTVADVPEPASALGLLCGAVPMLAILRRRKS